HLSPSTTRPPPSAPLFPYTTLFRSIGIVEHQHDGRRFRSRDRRRVVARVAELLGALRIGGALGAQGEIPYPWKRRLLTHDHLERSEEHTSELQSRSDLVCRLLLEKK